MSDSSLGHFEELISDNIRNSLASSTWNEYSKAWRDWNLFCHNFSASSEFSILELTLGFMATLMSSNLSASYISKTLAGVAFFLKIHNFTPFNYHFLVRQALKGYKKKFSNRDNRCPITFEILVLLVKALPNICSSYFESILFKASFILAFFGALRLSEFVAKSKNSVSFLKTSNVIISDNSLRIYIPYLNLRQISYAEEPGLLYIPSLARLFARSDL